MWIIPKNLHTSRFVPDTEALTSDLDELSAMCEQSLFQRSKPSLARTWSQRWRRASWMQLLFGRILRPSHGDGFEERWTSSLGASLASPSAPLADAPEQRTPATSSPLSSEELGLQDLPLFSWRTSRESSVQNSRATTGVTPKGRPFCLMSSENWRGWVTKQRRAYLARLKSARLIKGKECSSWREMETPRSLSVSLQARHTTPQAEGRSSTNGNHQEQWGTPQARDWKGGEGRSKASETGTDLPSQVVKNWQTPTAGEGGKISNNPESKGQRGLSNDPALRWATPAARDFKGHYSRRCQESPEKETRNLLPDQAHEGTYRGKLNPRWVETLMGLPVGWAQPSCANPLIIERTSSDCSETESSPKQRRGPSVSCGETWPTPPASQRGEDLTVYLRKCIKRMKAGGAPFAPTLQVATEAPAVSADLFKDLDLMRETEDLILEIKESMGK